MKTHKNWFEYKDIKDEWETSLDKGIYRACPSCGVKGIKDDKCTHMNCNNCNSVWWYLWGKENKDLDKSDSNGTIFSHNDGWKTNSKRCPLYLKGLGEIDDRYSKTDDTYNKTLFHKLLTYTEIRKFMKKHGNEKYLELCEVFPSIAQNGYDMEEAMTMDLTLIKR